MTQFVIMRAFLTAMQFKKHVIEDILALAEQSDAPIDSVYWVRLYEHNEDRLVWRTMTHLLAKASTKPEQEFLYGVLSKSSKLA